MAAKPETRYRLRVEKQLPTSVYKLKLALPYAGGVADSYYSWLAGDGWVEWKWLPSTPRYKPLDLTSGKKPMLSRLQQDWLEGRAKEGRNVAVIVGTPSGGLILRDLEWRRPLEVPDMVFYEAKEVAAWLTNEFLLP